MTSQVNRYLLLWVFAFLMAKRKILKDEKKLHGEVDESSPQQHFRKSDAITFVV